MTGKRISNIYSIVKKTADKVFRGDRTPKLSSGKSDNLICTANEIMDLKKVVGRVHEFAPPNLSAGWDNVGLLVEPSPPHEVKTLFLTNDLTPPVLDEAISKGANMIMSYHPPIFVPMKRLTQNSWKERLITKCIENRIAVYSQHTSHDAVKEGVNDWLISAFDVTDVSPIEYTESLPGNYCKRFTWTVKSAGQSAIMQALSSIKGVKVNCTNMDEDYVQLTILCKADKITEVVMVSAEHNRQIKNMEVYDLQKIPRIGYGMGRTGILTSAISLQEAVEKVKSHLQLKNVRLAASPVVDTVKKVAVCAGSGGSLLKNLPVDLYVTGEMSHHEVLNAIYSGTNVILCDHSNTERGFLHVLRTRLDKLLDNKVTVIVSEIDKDPLDIV